MTGQAQNLLVVRLTGTRY